jgi:TatD DNase family protein
MARQVSTERLLVETDCPYLAPEPHRGRRNEPAYVRDTAACLASVLDMPLPELIDALWHNTVRVLPAFAQLEVAA